MPDVKAVRYYQGTVAAVMWLYALGLLDTSAQIGVIVYMNNLYTHLAEFMAVAFIGGGAAILIRQGRVNVRWYLVCISPQLTYSAFAVGWWTTNDVNLGLAALWIHPAISVLMFMFAAREANYGLPDASAE